jgi:hypothetical protein
MSDLAPVSSGKTPWYRGCLLLVGRTEHTTCGTMTLSGLLPSKS